MVGRVPLPRSSSQKKVRISVITDPIVIPITPVEKEEEPKKVKFGLLNAVESYDTETTDENSISITTKESSVSLRSVPSNVESPSEKENVNATLKIKVAMAELKRPKNGIISSKKAPNPFFEIFIDLGHGPTKLYRSYPLRHCRGANWDEAIVDLGVPLDAIGYLGIDIRVMHCHKKGGEGSMIGLCVASEDGSAQQCGHAHPVLNEFQVMGWLRVVSLKVE